MAYRGDIALTTRTKSELENAHKKLEKGAKEYGLVINKQKTQYLKIRESSNGRNENIKIKVDT